MIFTIEASAIPESKDTFEYVRIAGFRRIREVLMMQAKSFDLSLRAQPPFTRKRFYTPREIAEFGADGTPWQEMYVVALSNIERGNFYPVALENVRRMGELACLSNKQIGSAIARAKAMLRKSNS